MIGFEQLATNADHLVVLLLRVAPCAHLQEEVGVELRGLRVGSGVVLGTIHVHHLQIRSEWIGNVIENRQTVQCETVGGFCGGTHVADGGRTIGLHADRGAWIAGSGREFEASHENIDRILGVTRRTKPNANLIGRDGEWDARDRERSNACVRSGRGVGNGHEHRSQALRIRSEMYMFVRKHPFYRREQHLSQKDLS